MNNLNERIKKLRKDKGLTQAELANELNITDKAVSKWEVGEANPDIELIVKLASIFDTTVDYLLTGKKPVVKTVTISKMELCCKNDDVELFKELKNYTDESGIHIVDYIEKYDAKNVLIAYIAAKPETKPMRQASSEDLKAVELSLKYNLFDSLILLGALDYDFADDNNIARNSLYYKDEHQQVPHDKENDRSYRPDYGNRKMLFDVWPNKKILDYYFEFKSLDKALEEHKKRHQMINRSHFYDVNYSGVLLDFMTMAIDQKNVNKIKAIWAYIQKYQQIELAEYEKARKSTEQYVYSLSARLRYEPTDNDKEAFRLVSLSESQIIELLKLGLFDIAREANEFAHKDAAWSAPNWEKGKVERNQFIKYAELIKNPKADMRFLDVSIDGVVIIKRLLNVDDPKFIVDTLKQRPVYECEKLYKLYKENRKKEIFEFAVDKGLNSLAKKCFTGAYGEETLKIVAYMIGHMSNSHSSSYVNNVEDINAIKKLIELDNLNGYCFIQRLENGNPWPVYLIRENQRSGFDIASAEKQIDAIFDALNEYKQEIIDKYSARLKVQEMIQKTYTKDFFLKEIANGNIENCVIKLCTLFELKLKSDGKTGDFSEMMKNYCQKFYNYDEEYNEYCEDRHMVEILNRLRIMRNNYLHADFKDVEPLSNEELVECIDEIFGREVK